VTLLALANARGLPVDHHGRLTPAVTTRLLRRWGLYQGHRTLRGGEQHRPLLHFTRLVLQQAGLLHYRAANDLRPTRAVATWLRLSRHERLQTLVDAWVASSWNELTHLLGFRARTDRLQHDLPGARRNLLSLLRQLPSATWFGFDSLADEIRRVAPDMARPASDFTTWELRDRLGRPADGYSAWPQVEGGLIEACIARSMYWLGLCDIGTAPPRVRDDPPIPSAWRLNSHGTAVLHGVTPPSEPLPPPIVITTDGELQLPPETSMLRRFQVARIATHLGGSDPAAIERYRITRASLAAALDQQIAIDDIIGTLDQAGEAGLPDALAERLHEWAAAHGELRLQRAVLLRAYDSTVLTRVAADPRVRLPPVTTLNPDTWLLAEGDAVTLATRLRHAGYGLAGTVEQIQPGLSAHDLTTLTAALQIYRTLGEQASIETEPTSLLEARLAQLLNEQQRAAAERIAAQFYTGWQLQIAVAQPDQPTGNPGGDIDA
jgi:hypothetical protein